MAYLLFSYFVCFFVCLFFTVSILYVCSIAELHAPVPPAPQHPALSHRHIPAAQHRVRQQFTLKAAPVHQIRLRGSVGAPSKFKNKNKKQTADFLKIFFFSVLCAQFGGPVPAGAVLADVRVDQHRAGGDARTRRLPQARGENH